MAFTPRLSSVRARPRPLTSPQVTDLRPHHGQSWLKDYFPVTNVIVPVAEGVLFWRDKGSAG